MGTPSEDNMGTMTEDGVRTTQSGAGQTSAGAYNGSGAAVGGGPGSGSAGAAGLTNEFFGAALADAPLVPAARNPLIGRWRTTGGNAGTDLSSIGPLGDMSSGMLAGGCEEMFGKTVVFGPSTYERVSADGHAEVQRHIEYHGQGATIAVLAPGTGTQPTILRLSDRDHATSALGCTLERDASAGVMAGAQGANGAPAALASGQGYLRMIVGATGPGGFSPLAGSHVWITHVDPAQTLAKAGYQAMPGGSPAGTLAANCGTPFDCNRIFVEIGDTADQVLRPGPDGLGASQPLASGSYYVVGLAPYQAKAIVWAVPISLKAGANSLKLDQSNGLVVR
jgi:hypothetical protein